MKEKRSRNDETEERNKEKIRKVKEGNGMESRGVVNSGNPGSFPY
jgi:hypothetical protein